MCHKIYIAFLSILLIVIISCKKDKIAPSTILDSPSIAPCSIGESFYDIDSVYYNPNSYQLEAKFRVRYIDTLSTGQACGLLEFFFNKIPTSGIYKMVEYIDTNNFNIPNQIAYVADSGSFMMRSNNAELSEIYVENNSNELIISWCSLPDTLFTYDIGSMSYVGNSPFKRKIRKIY